MTGLALILIGDGMMDYRAFLLDDDGHVFAREDIIAKNDEEAVLRALQLLNRHAVEVWQRDREVALIKAPKVRPAA